MKNQQAETRNLEHPLDHPFDKKVEQHARLLNEIRDDARELAERYPKETVVPEGGE